MNKKLSLIVIPISITAPVLSVVSCQATIDKKTMNWSLDFEKINNIKKNGLIQNFNDEPLSVDKLKKIIKLDLSNGNNGDNFIERYTIEAFNKGWFETISFNQNNVLIIKLLASKKDANGKEIYCPYTLPNGSLEMRY